MTHTRHFVCVAAAVKDAANQAAHTLQIDPEGKLNTFTIGLNSSGDSSAATYYSAMGRMPQAAQDQILKNIQSGQSLPALWFSVNDDSGKDLGLCFASFDGSHIGEIMTFDSCLAACGLKRRTIPLPT